MSNINIWSDFVYLDNSQNISSITTFPPFPFTQLYSHYTTTKCKTRTKKKFRLKSSSHQILRQFTVSSRERKTATFQTISANLSREEVSLHDYDRLLVNVGLLVTFRIKFLPFLSELWTATTNAFLFIHCNAQIFPLSPRRSPSSFSLVCCLLTTLLDNHVTHNWSKVRTQRPAQWRH